jgi:riboflavin synthase
MFTGLIEARGRVALWRVVEFGARLEIEPATWEHRAKPGESIAVNGCCLTVADIAASGGVDRWRFDVIRQTLDVTALGGLSEGALVNLESSATPTTLLGGHLVQGHVDGVGRVLEVLREPSQWRLRIETPPALGPLVVDRGSIAIEGVSLTVAAIEVADRPSWFEVALIPTTLERTTLCLLKPGDQVNLESDCLVRAVAHLMRWRRASE